MVPVPEVLQKRIMRSVWNKGVASPGGWSSTHRRRMGRNLVGCLLGLGLFCPWGLVGVQGAEAKCPAGEGVKGQEIATGCPLPQAPERQAFLVFGQSTALTGPTSELGLGMRLGLQAAFDEANRKGGIAFDEANPEGVIQERRLCLCLVSLDDAYEPEAAIANTRELIEDHQVLALVGAVGTPTSLAAQPVAAEAGRPYIAPFTGAEFLREASQRPNVVNMRASYFQETTEIVARLTEDLGLTRIGIFHQNDSYGRAGLQGLRLALKARGLPLVAQADYPRNTESVKVPLLDLRRFQPEAVVIVGAYKPAATLIRWARRLSFNPYFVNISFVGSSALARELGQDGEGVYIAQVVPFPGDAGVPAVAAYQSALAAEAVPGFVSLEGYLAGRLLIEGVRRAGAEVTPARLLRALRQASSIDLGGFELSYGPDDNQGSDRVYLTRIDANGKVQPITKMSKR